MEICRGYWVHMRVVHRGSLQIWLPSVIPWTEGVRITMHSVAQALHSAAQGPFFILVATSPPLDWGHWKTRHSFVQALHSAAKWALNQTANDQEACRSQCQWLWQGQEEGSGSKVAVCIPCSCSLFPAFWMLVATAAQGPISMLRFDCVY